MSHDPFRTRSRLTTARGPVTYFSLPALERQGFGSLARLPYSIRVLLEAALRNVDGFIVTEADVRKIAGWTPQPVGDVEIPFLPGRVVLQDFTGVPCVVDLAAMRAAMRRLGGDPKKINPLVPCDLVIDHSVQVDWFGSGDALAKNVALEFERNRERYEFLKWGQQSLRNFRCVPPATGIVHQVNLEHLAGVVLTRTQDGETVAYPDSCVGTDSHTTMINGLGVVGWGVGGIEAEAVMLGQPVYMLLPEVVGFELRGKLPEGATATDLVLSVTQMLRKHGVVNKFVEFHGDGLRNLTLADRATIANMAPEYGATMGFFPVDEETLAYLRLTGRSDEQIELVRSYCKAQGLFFEPGLPKPQFSSELGLDMAAVVPSLAGPKRPQDRVALRDLQANFRTSLAKPLTERGFGLSGAALEASAEVKGQSSHRIGHGAVVIAAITSCTNTSNPDVLVAAGLVARKARARGLGVAPWVKTSLAPGSRVVTDYLQKSKLDADLDALGFQTVGYGCTTCIGNSGPLPDAVRTAVQQGKLVAAAVLSGNRNFEGRVNPDVKANYLASPPLVVAYAIAGTVDIDLAKDPLGVGKDGKPVFLKDIWPSTQEVKDAVKACVTQGMFRSRYADMAGPEAWQALAVASSELYSFKTESTYIQEPPFFLDMARTPSAIAPIAGARCLVKVADSVTTDHISPAGSIKADSPAGRFLVAHGVTPKDFNSYGARRGNDRVMTRGTFANIQLRNEMAPGTEGGVTRHVPSGRTMAIFDAAELYAKESTPLCVLAGKEYGTGSSRDWAAKGTMLLGVRFVLAESYERIHRSNLVGMGVLPLQYRDGESAASLGLSGDEVFAVAVDDRVTPRQVLKVTATNPATGTTKTFEAICRIDTPVEVEYYRNGGILQTVLRKLL
ncbi:MAG: aconitate hydratase AcnA [Planctomycetes bacterium]|nr:aconitate hydratase AcnA [Planctomycetota bacterium]